MGFFLKKARGKIKRKKDGRGYQLFNADLVTTCNILMTPITKQCNNNASNPEPREG
jgi:hypothetical protein